MDSLQDPKLHSTHFDEAELQAAIEGYEALENALKTGEMRVLRFIAEKK